MHMKENHFIYATLILRGKGLNPDELTFNLGLNPSMSYKCGDWRNEKDKWKDNFWSINSQDRVQSKNINIHLEWLINFLEPVQSQLCEIIQRSDIKAEISCLWILPTSHEVLSLNPELLGRIASLGLKLEIDIYGPD